MGLTTQQIKDNAPDGATHYKILKSFTGRIKHLYYKVGDKEIKELISSNVVVIRNIEDVDIVSLKPL